MKIAEFAVKSNIISQEEADSIIRKNDNITAGDIICNLAAARGFDFFVEDCLQYFLSEED